MTADATPRTLLTHALACATVATNDLEQARYFYEQTLALAIALEDERRGVYYRCGRGTMVNLYERKHTPSEQTVATFLVDDLEGAMAELRKKGVTFQEYDLPDLKTKGGVYSDETGFKVAWLKDPDGNLLSIEQLAIE
jgi:catechol 2,3-dioxygenase-like lactoylglutathione lyase family enzyme